MKKIIFTTSTLCILEIFSKKSCFKKKVFFEFFNTPLTKSQ